MSALNINEIRTGDVETEVWRDCIIRFKHLTQSTREMKGNIKAPIDIYTLRDYDYHLFGFQSIENAEVNLQFVGVNTSTD